MDRIKKYINKFLKEKKMNKRFSITLNEFFLIKDAIKDNANDVITTIFEYGYVKGYRAAMAEMKRKAG